MQGSIPKEQLEFLARINILDVLGISKKSQEEQDQFMKKFLGLAWEIFFETDAHNLGQEEFDHIKTLASQNRFDEIEQFIAERVPHIEDRASKNALLAKKLLLKETFEKRLQEARETNEKEYFMNMTAFIEADQWDKFISYLNQR